LDDAAINARKEIILQPTSNPNTNDHTKKKGGKPSKPGKGSKNGSNPDKPSPNPLKTPPRKGESHEKVMNGKTLYWCGKQSCSKWTTHKTSDHPTGSTPPADTNTGNPQGHHIKDIGDDSKTSESAGFFGFKPIRFLIGCLGLLSLDNTLITLRVLCMIWCSGNTISLIEVSKLGALLVLGIVTFYTHCSYFSLTIVCTYVMWHWYTTYQVYYLFGAIEFPYSTLSCRRMDVNRERHFISARWI
jgi:hypothetical protein